MAIDLVGVGSGCPDGERLAAALAREGVLVDDSAPTRIAVRATESVIVLEVPTEDGVSTRSLEAPEPTDGSRCAALADALAAMAARALDGVRWSASIPPADVAIPEAEAPRAAGRTLDPPEAPPDAPAPLVAPTARLSLGAGAVLGQWIDRGDVAVGPHLAADLIFELLEVGLTAAWLLGASLPAGPGALAVTHVPIGLEGGVGVTLDVVRLGLRARAEVSVIEASTSGLARDESAWSWAVHAGASVVASVALIPELLLGLRASALGLVSGHSFEVEGLDEPVAEHAAFAGSVVVFAAANISLGS